MPEVLCCAHCHTVLRWAWVPIPDEVVTLCKPCYEGLAAKQLELPGLEEARLSAYWTAVEDGIAEGQPR